MEAGIVTALIASCLPVSVFVTTLRFLIDVSLLVLDGKRVPSSLLCGVDSIELGNGPYQLVFRVGRMTHLSNGGERPYVSPPLVVSFNTQLTNQVNFCLSRLENKREVNHFDIVPCLELLDGDTAPIPAKLDILATTSTARTIDYEVEVEYYNKPAGRASLSQFATMMIDNNMLLSGVSELDTTPLQSQVLIEQWLKYWFELADPQA